MSQLFKVASPRGEPPASVLFVHGLGGHHYDTWRSNTDRKHVSAMDVGAAMAPTIQEEPPKAAGGGQVSTRLRLRTGSFVRNIFKFFKRKSPLRT